MFWKGCAQNATGAKADVLSERVPMNGLTNYPGRSVGVAQEKEPTGQT